MYKWVGNMAHILAYLFNSASRHDCEDLAFQFPILQNIKDSIPSSEACQYCCINWSLAQAHQQYSLGLPECSTSMRHSRAKPKAGFRFNVQKQPVLEVHLQVPLIVGRR